MQSSEKVGYMLSFCGLMWFSFCICGTDRKHEACREAYLAKTALFLHMQMFGMHDIQSIRSIIVCYEM